jgi:APA family basic amino acid/polyamine antiporter
VVAIFTGLSFSQVARHVDKEGGVYEYGKEALNPYAGFIGGTLWTYGNIIALAAVSNLNDSPVFDQTLDGIDSDLVKQSILTFYLGYYDL